MAGLTELIAELRTLRREYRLHSLSAVVVAHEDAPPVTVTLTAHGFEIETTHGGLLINDDEADA